MEAKFRWLKTKSKILNDLGLTQNTQLFFAEECYRKMFPYIPAREMQMARNVKITATQEDGEILFRTPYSHYQWAGILYLAENGSSWAKLGETKYPSDRKLNYSKSLHPLATSHFDEVMWETYEDEIVKSVDNYRIREAK